MARQGRGLFRLKGTVSGNVSPPAMIHRLSQAAREMASRHKALANALLGLVQLRFRISYGAVQDLCDLAMTVAVELVQFKNRAVAEGESVEGALESDAVK